VACEEETVSASEKIARLRELHAEHLKAAGPFKSPRNRRPLDHLRLAELDRDFVAAASVALPALLECASALEQLLDDLGQLAPAEPSIQAVEEARAALQALSQTTGDNQ
jgi:hypothetical protein